MLNRRMTRRAAALAWVQGTAAKWAACARRRWPPARDRGRHEAGGRHEDGGGQLHEGRHESDGRLLQMMPGMVVIVGIEKGFGRSRFRSLTLVASIDFGDYAITVRRMFCRTLGRLSAFATRRRRFCNGLSRHRAGRCLPMRGRFGSAARIHFRMNHGCSRSILPESPYIAFATGCQL